MPERSAQMAEMLLIQRASNAVFAQMADSILSSQLGLQLGFVGFGLDLCNIPEMAEAIGDKGFAERYFTANERLHNGMRGQRYATNFAIKEAVIKTGITWPEYLVEIEVLHDSEGAPSINLSGSARRKAENLGIERFLVSATHEGDWAVAACLGVGRKRYVYSPLTPVPYNDIFFDVASS